MAYLAINIAKPIEMTKIGVEEFRPFCVAKAQENIINFSKNDTNHPEEIYWGQSDLTTTRMMLEKLGVVVRAEDKLAVFPKPELGLGSIIKIKRAMPVVINDGGRQERLFTWSNTVGEILAEKKIELADKDVVLPTREAVIARETTIRITRVAEASITKKIVLGYRTVYKYDKTILKGKWVVVQPGKKGLREKVYKLRRENGVEIKKVLVSNKIIKSSKNRVIAVGTKVKSKPKPNPKPKPKVLGTRSKIKKTVHRGTLREMVKAAAKKYGVSADGLWRVMMCESGGNRYARGCRGSCYGLFQYKYSTWLRSSFGSYDIYDAWAQINAAASAWGYRYSMWPSCSWGT